MKTREQRMKEKIAKLKKLGIYERWEKNLKGQPSNENPEAYRDYLLGSLTRTSDVIACAFMFRGTPEGDDFWKDVVNKLIALGD